MKSSTPVIRGLSAAVAGVGAFLGGAFVAGAQPSATTTVLSGQDLVTTASGFAPGAVVERRLDNRRLPDTARADDAGRVHITVRAPEALGRHRLLVVGPAPSRPAGVVPATGAPGDDLQAIVAVVPLVVVRDFQVVPSLGVDAVDRSRDQGAGGGLGTAGESATADTGVNLVLPSLIGAGLVLFGAIVTRFGRRRPTRR